MWAWSSQLYLGKYNKRSHRRDELALRALFESSVEACRVPICGLEGQGDVSSV
jgi:hypothetical protein